MVGTRRCRSKYPGRGIAAFSFLQALRTSSCSLQRDIAVFFLGVGVAFIFERAERSNNTCAGIGRLDDRVDIAAFSGDKRIGKALAEFGDFLLAEFFSLGSG